MFQAGQEKASVALCWDYKGFPFKAGTYPDGY